MRNWRSSKKQYWTDATTSYQNTRTLKTVVIHDERATVMMISTLDDKVMGKQQSQKEKNNKNEYTNQSKHVVIIQHVKGVAFNVDDYFSMYDLS